MNKYICDPMALYLVASGFVTLMLLDTKQNRNCIESESPKQSENKFLLSYSGRCAALSWWKRWVITFMGYVQEYSGLQLMYHGKNTK